MALALGQKHQSDTGSLGGGLGPRKLMFVQIADALGRFEILSNAFITEADFQQTLAVFYADILQFHKHAYKFVRRSGKWEAFCSTFRYMPVAVTKRIVVGPSFRQAESHNNSMSTAN